MRLFTGLSLAPAALGQTEAILDELRPTADLRWSPPGNLHITTAFIGSWEESRLEDLKSALAAVPFPAPIPISISGFGYFPNPHHPHTLFLAVNQDPALTALANGLETALIGLGCKREERPYHPHVTLARVARENITQLRFQTASMNNIFPLPAFEATKFHLYLSQPTPAGSEYSAIATFPAAGEK